MFDHVHLRVFLGSNSFFIVQNCIQFSHSQCNTAFFYRSSNWFDLARVCCFFSVLNLFDFFFFVCFFNLNLQNKTRQKQCKAKLNFPATILSLLLIPQYLYISGHKHWGCTRSQHIVHYLIQLSMMYCKCIFKKHQLLVFGEHFETNNYSNRNHPISFYIM